MIAVSDPSLLRRSAQGYLRLEHAEPEHADILVVNWSLSNVCNFKCSYCPPSLHDHSMPWPEYSVVERFCQRTIDHYRARKIYFEFTGGEATLWKDFLPLCRWLKGRGADVGLISNGSRALDWWEQARDYINHVCLSFHSESADRDHFLAVARLLRERVRVHVNVMMLPESFDYCYETARMVRDLDGISLALQTLIRDLQTEPYPYTPEQRERLERQHVDLSNHIEKSAFPLYRGSMVAVRADGLREVAPSHQFIGTGNNHWTGWDCAIGLEQIVVDSAGEVSRGWCRVGERLGNIRDEVVRLPTEPVRCTKAFCHCGFDITATKWRPGERPTSGLAAAAPA